MFLDGLVIMVTYSRRIGFTTIDFLESQNSKVLHKSIKRTLALYKHRGIPVKCLATDRQFLPLEDELLMEDDVKLNVTSASEHVGDVERDIRFVKEKNRCMTAGLPYKIIPKLMENEFSLPITLFS